MIAQTGADCAGLDQQERDTLRSCSHGLAVIDNDDMADGMPDTMTQERETRASTRNESPKLTAADVELLHTIAGDSDPEVWKRVGPMNVFLAWDQIEQLQSLRRRIAGILESA